MARIRAAAPDMVTSASADEVAEFVFRLRDGQLDGWQPPRAWRCRSRPTYGDIEHRDARVRRRRPRPRARGARVDHQRRARDATVSSTSASTALMTDFPARAFAVLRPRGLR